MADRGGQIGNSNATKAKPWRDAIDRAIAQDNGKRLRAIAEKLLDKAAEGDISAIKELGDRLDGKAHQSISGPDGQPIIPPKVTINFVSPGDTSQLSDEASAVIHSGPP